jgi:hypothetical protein
MTGIEEARYKAAMLDGFRAWASRSDVLVASIGSDDGRFSDGHRRLLPLGQGRPNFNLYSS